MEKYSYIGKYSDGGSRNSFYKIKGKRYGFKGFPNKSLAEFAHKAQSTLAVDSLAPRVYSQVCKIRVPNYFAKADCNGNMKTVQMMVLSDWGYLTEIAQPYICSSEHCGGDCANDDACDNYYDIHYLLDSIQGCDLDYIDAHESNLGYVKRGKYKVLVVIDLGAESVSATSDYYPSVCWDGDEDFECYCEKCRKNNGVYQTIKEHEYA